MSAIPPTADPPKAALLGTRLDGAAAARLHARAAAGRWGLTVDRFHEALERVLAKRFSESPATPAAVLAYVDSLHLEDLALARGCADGVDTAWEAFVGHHWREACRAARAIAGDTDGEELADALLADLFAHGSGSQAARRPLFDYFHGRSKLTTWLRALLAQRHVDRLRASRRLEPLDEEAADAVPAPAADRHPDQARLVDAFQRALDAALQVLSPRERLRLAYYHADDLTLAAIGRLMGEHEATVSRKLQKTRDQLKGSVDAALRAELRLGADELRECYALALAAGGIDPGRLRLVHPPAGEGAGAASGP